MTAGAFTAPDGATVMPNGSHVPSGAQVNLPAAADVANMGPTERFNAFARAYGATEVAVPLSERIAASKAAPPSTVSKTPPSPQELEASRIAQFDADMRAAGIQQPPAAPSQPTAGNPQGFETAGNGMRIPNGQGVDAAALDRLNKGYTRRMGQIQDELNARDTDGKPRYTDGQRVKLEAQMSELRAEYHAELAKIVPGGTPPQSSPASANPPGDLGPDDAESPYWSQARMDGTGQLTTVGRQLEARIRQEFAAGTPEQQRDPANIDATNVALVSVRANADGMVPVASFHPGMLHGYKLPTLVPDQHYAPDAIQQLARAKAAGITQAQLEKYIRDDMRSRGYKV